MLQIRAAVFGHNSGEVAAGSLWLEKVAAVIEDCAFEVERVASVPCVLTCFAQGNSASNYGVAFFNSSEVTISHTRFTSNCADGPSHSHSHHHLRPH